MQKLYLRAYNVNDKIGSILIRSAYGSKRTTRPRRRVHRVVGRSHVAVVANISNVVVNNS